MCGYFARFSRSSLYDYRIPTIRCLVSIIPVCRKPARLASDAVGIGRFNVANPNRDRQTFPIDFPIAVRATFRENHLGPRVNRAHLMYRPPLYCGAQPPRPIFASARQMP